MKNNRIIWISGASTGIGRATSIKFANEGWTVVATSRNMDNLSTLKNEIDNRFGSKKISIFGCDIREKEQVEIAREPRHTMWERHLKRIRKYGFTGIVCSAHDISDIKDNSILKICPGITFQSSNSGQVRTVSPRTAQDLDADYAIIGRSITKADHPVEKIEAIKHSLTYYNR